MSNGLLKRLLCIAGLFSVTALCAAGCHRFASADQRVSHAREHIREKFDLSPDQLKILDRGLAALKSIAFENRDLHKQDIASLRANLERGGAIDKQEFMSLYNERRVILDKHVDTVAEALADLSATLTPEQRKQLIAMLAKVQTHFSR